jgi:hypothetical protein
MYIGGIVLDKENVYWWDGIGQGKCTLVGLYWTRKMYIGGIVLDKENVYWWDAIGQGKCILVGLDKENVYWWDGTGQGKCTLVGWYWTRKPPNIGRKIPHSRVYWRIMYKVNGYSSVSIVTKVWTERRMVTSLFLLVPDFRWVRNPCGFGSEGHLMLLPKARVTRML